MKETFPYRLKSARKRAGMSMRQLSEALDNRVSYNAIKKYEDGKMLPERAVLLSLADALKVQLEYFSRPVRFDLGDIEFRKRASLGIKQIDSIKEETRDLLERYIEVEQLCGIETDFVNPLAKLEIRTEADVETAADALRKSWQLGVNPIPNVIEMMEEQEIKVLEIKAPDKFDGLSTYVTGIPVTILNKTYFPDRKRFTALHELGHLVLSIPDTADKEKVCNRFAGAMLIAETEMKRLLGRQRTNVPQLGELTQIKQEYGISVQALMRRAYDLDIINRTIYQKFSKMIARHRKEEQLGEFKGEERAFRFLQLIFRLVSEGAISMPRAANLAGLSLDEFKARYYRTDKDELDWAQEPEATAFARAFGEDEPEYDFTDIIELNPDYDPR